MSKIVLGFAVLAASLACAPAAHADTFCRMDVIALGATSCPFAMNVLSAYNSLIGSGTGTLNNIYSPTTGGNYTMYCNQPYSPTREVVCTGGNGAAVRFNFR
jgi:hypothetical protein